MVEDSRISLLAASVGNCVTLELDNGQSFQLLEELGRGGSCIAYLATALSGPKAGHTQVVKEFFPQGKSISSIKREGSRLVVTDERQNAAFNARVAHFEKGIESLNMFWGKDGGVHADPAEFSRANGTLYSVSDVAGKHLLKDEPPTDMNVIAQVMISTCTALGKLHGNVAASGKPEPLVYLDCKPSNLFWTDIDGERWHLVRLFDFDTQASLGALKSGENAFVSGSDGWMAPEQACLLDDDADVRAMGRSLLSEAADIYAVGAVFFWLIYGRPPKLEDDTASDVSLIEHDRIGLVRRHPDRKYFPRKFDSDRVKRKAAEILLETLCVNPDGRCSMEQLADDFGKLLEITEHNRSTIAYVDERIDRLERYLTEQDERRTAEAQSTKGSHSIYTAEFSYDMFENCALSWRELGEVGRAIAEAGEPSRAMAMAKECGLVEPDGRLKLLCKDMLMKSGERATVRIVGISHDPMPDGGRAGLTFGFVSPIGFQAMNEKKTNKGGWCQSDLRRTLENDYLENLLPEEVVESIRPVIKLTNNKGKTTKASCVTETVDRLWLFSRRELAGEWNAKAVWIESPDAPLYDRIADGEGLRYRLFTQLGVDDPYGLKAKDLSRQAPLVVRESSGSKKYWLRSPDPDNGSDFGVVLELGQIANGYSSTGRYGVVPGFCF